MIYDHYNQTLELRDQTKKTLLYNEALQFVF